MSGDALEIAQVLSREMSGKSTNEALIIALAPFAQAGLEGAADCRSESLPDWRSSTALDHLTRVDFVRALLVWSISEPSSLKMMALDDAELTRLITENAAARASHECTLANAQTLCASGIKALDEALIARQDALRLSVRKLTYDAGYWLWGAVSGFVIALNWIGA